MHICTRGVLLSVECIDGSGKSTLVSLLAKRLEQDRLPVLTTKEPGGSQLGSVLRALVQKKEIPIGAKAEYLLFAANRAQHFEECVIPALHNNTIVISDRMADSSLVYQGFGRNLDIDMLKTINSWTMAGYKPDITLYVKVDIEIAHKRLAQRNIAPTSFEKENSDFITKIYNGFETIFANKNHVITLDGSQDIATVADQAYQTITAWLQKNNVVQKQ